MLREVLIGTLRQAHRALGLYLEEEEDFLYLRMEGQEKPLAIWISSVVTVAMIQDAADKIIEKEESNG